MKRSPVIRALITLVGLAGVLGVGTLLLTARNHLDQSVHTVAGPTSRATSTSALTAGPALTDASVRTVVDETYGASARGSRSACNVDGATGVTGTCPFSPRLRAQLDRLSRWTPSPGGVFDACDYSLITGIQGALPTPTAETHTITAGTATATLAIRGQPVVTVTIIDSHGAALVDDITYDLTDHRSVYTLNCLWPPGSH